MSSPPRSREREEQRRLNLRTLAIASIASATAAVVTSQFWAGGTPIAAAVTPVIVALVSEMLHKPTEVIARRITSERPALSPRAERSRTIPPPAREPGDPPVRVYGRDRKPRRRKIAVGVVATTAVLAFAIAAAALTVPDLIAGHSFINGDRNATIVPTKRKKSNSSGQQTTPTTTSPSQQSTQTTPQQSPQSTTTTPAQTETTTTQTQTTPKSSGK
ncbi:MAG: hypothetical protein ACJ766_03710 [Thermoleophilaceae bacterium]